jgi:hypothetical protein
VPEETDHAPNGLVPPEVTRVWWYAPVWVAAGSVDGEIVGLRLTVRVKECVAVTPLASVKVPVKVWEVAVELTLPEITPVDGLSVRPVGRLPVMLHV